jgi:acetyltransferase-like isoleucine patch superfamily enzyme
MNPVKRTVRRLVKYAGARLWEQVQWPDIEEVYRNGGMFAVVGFLQQSCDPDLTKRILARFGATIHPDCWPIGPNITMHDCPQNFANLVIGPHAHIGRQVFFDLADKIIIEESVAIGMRTIILTHLNMGHGYPNKPVQHLFPLRRKPTIFRRGCSVGAGAIIACGVEIGEDSVVNAGVLVDRDVPPRTWVASTRHKADVKLPDSLFENAARKLPKPPSTT